MTLSFVGLKRNFGSFMSWKQPKSGLDFHEVQNSMGHPNPTPAGLGIESLLKKRWINGMTMFWIMH
jgi:hypothetical protein